MNSTELRGQLCDLYAERTRREKKVLEWTRAAGVTIDKSTKRYLSIIDDQISAVEFEIRELDAATPQDQRILDAELSVAHALGHANGVRSRHAEALAEVEAADADLDKAVEAAKATIAQVAAENPDLRGKVGETGCFQIARSTTYKHLILAVSLDVVLKFWRDAAQDLDVEAEQEAEDAISIKPAFVTKHCRLFDDLIEEKPTTTVRFVKAAFGTKE